MDLKKPTFGRVFMVLAPDCPLCQTYSTEIVKLSNATSSNLEFYGIMAGGDYSHQEIKHFVDSFQFEIPILMDKWYDLTKQLRATVTPEFFLVDSLGQTVYSGKFDDWATGLAQKKIKPTQFYLQDAIEAYTLGKSIKVTRTEPIGCVLENN